MVCKLEKEVFENPVLIKINSITSMYNPNLISKFLLMLSTLIISYSCSGDYDNYSETSNEKPVIFPDYTDITIPVNIAPLNFKMPGAKQIRAQVFVNEKQVFDIKSDSVIEFPIEDWKEQIKSYAGKELSITLTAWTSKNPDGIRYKPFNVKISQDKIDPWIAYRLIPPGYELWKRMGIYQRNITNFDEEPIVTNDQNNGGCVNCHNFCKYNPDTWVFHARGEGGGTIVTYKGVSRKVAIEKKGPQKGATYPAWHPSGRYIVFSSNVTRQNFYGISRDKIEVFDTESDLIVYDVLKDNVLADTRFTERHNWETFPTFSPDGKNLYYCVAHSNDESNNANRKPTFFWDLKYSLCRVPFDETTGKFGEQVDTIYSAYREGGSVSFPRISPDGRYLLYTLADCATFPIQHVEADLKMKDLTTGDSINTNILNSEYSDSYHSWSSNGKWIIFSSKRVDGRYTRLFFSHFDGKGNFTKPFLLPQEDPEHNMARLNAYNIPEFIKAKEKVDKDKMANFFHVK